MSEIKQVLSFDASQAIATLAKLDGAMTQFEKRLLSTSAASTAFNTASQRIGKSFQAIGQQSTIASQSVQQNVGRMTTSLQLLSRIVFTQFIVRALSQMRRAFEATASTAADFQASISRIQTIDDSAQSFAQLSENVRALSDEFNIPLLEAAEGVYQAISNQVGDAATSFKFSAEAARLARATNSSLADSVDLLSGALKSYNLDASEADRISSVFFKTIDLGRVEAGELANTFGRVGPVAADLGLSLEEVSGALAAITVRGSKTSEALTQVRAITTALLKPSEAMGKALTALGFASGESAIKTLGLAGTLEALNRQANGDSAALAAMFQNVRGLSGASSLLGDDLQSLVGSIREMSTVSRDFANQKFLQATANDAETVRASLNKLSNAFTQGLGNSLLRTSASVIEMSGGVDTLTSALKFASPAILGAGAAVAVLATELTAARVAGLSLNKALGALALIPLAQGAGTSIGDFLNEKLSANRNKGVKEIEAATAAELESFKAAQKQKVDAANAADQQRIDSARRAFQAISRFASPQQITTAINADASVTALEQVLGRQLTTLDQVANGLEEAAKKAAALRTKMTEALSVPPQAEALRVQLDEIFASISGRGGGFTGDFAEGLRSQLAELKTQLAALAQDSNITEAELNEVIAKRNQFGQEALAGENPLVGKLGFAQDIQQLDAALVKLQQLKALQAQSTVDPGLQAQLSALEQVLAQNPAGQFSSASSSISSAAGPSQAIAAAWERAAAAAERTARAAAQAAGARKKNFGGSMYLADGGFASRGADTIPAMLSPGEFVVNARSAHNFAAQLQAINAGQNPVFREDGGTVNNYSIGDVVVNGVRDPAAMTGDEIIRAVNRAQRRGTGRVK